DHQLDGDGLTVDVHARDRAFQPVGREQADGGAARFAIGGGSVDDRQAAGAQVGHGDLLGAGAGCLEGDRLRGGAIGNAAVDVACQPDHGAGGEREHEDECRHRGAAAVGAGVAHGPVSARNLSSVAYAVACSTRAPGWTATMPRSDTMHVTVTDTTASVPTSTAG